MEDITPELAEKFRNALCNAYNKEELEEMIYFHLNERLDVIIDGNGSLARVTFLLIDWAKTKGRLQEFISGAMVKNPENPELKQFHQDWLEWQKEPKPQNKPKNPAKVSPQKSETILSINPTIESAPIASPSVENSYRPKRKENSTISLSLSDLPSSVTNGSRIDKSTVSFSSKSAQSKYGNWNCAELTDIGYVVSWDCKYEFALTIKLNYVYGNERLCKQIMFVADLASAKIISELPNIEVVVIKANLQGALDSSHLRLEYQLLDFQLVGASEYFGNSLTSWELFDIIEKAEIGLKLWYKG